MNELAARALHDRLWTFVRRRVGSDTDADDVTQQIFVRILDRLDQLRDDDSIHAWTWAIARNAVADHHRKRAVVAGTDVADVATEPDSATEPVETIAACLVPLLDELPETYREALTLTDAGGLSQAQAAARLGVSPSGMRSRVQRGRARLRKQLEDCCRFEQDKRGRIIDFERKGPSCC